MNKVRTINKGDAITINAVPTSNKYLFERWEVLSGEASLSNNTQKTITFTPTTNVSLRAVFKANTHTVYIKGIIKGESSIREEFSSLVPSTEASIPYPHDTLFVAPQNYFKEEVVFNGNTYRYIKLYEIEKGGVKTSLVDKDYYENDELLIDQDAIVVGLFERQNSVSPPPSPYPVDDVVLVDKNIQGMGTETWTFNSITFRIDKAQGDPSFSINEVVIPLNGQQTSMEGGNALTTTSVDRQGDNPTWTATFDFGMAQFNSPTSEARAIIVTNTGEELTLVITSY